MYFVIFLFSMSYQEVRRSFYLLFAEVKVGKVVLTDVMRVEGESGGRASFTLFSALNGEVSGHFTRSKSPRCPLNRRLAGLQSWSGCFGEEINLLSRPGFELRIVRPVVWSLYLLRYRGWLCCLRGCEYWLEEEEVEDKNNQDVWAQKPDEISSQV